MQGRLPAQYRGKKQTNNSLVYMTWRNAKSADHLTLFCELYFSVLGIERFSIHVAKQQGLRMNKSW